MCIIPAMIAYLLLIYLLSSGITLSVSELGRFGGTGSDPGQFKNPSAIDVNDKGELFICDRGNHRIQIFDEGGHFKGDIGGFGWQEERFDEPADIWARATLNIFVADYNNQRVQRFDKDMYYIDSKYSNEGATEVFQFQDVLSIVYSSQGDLFLLDGGEFKIIKFNARGQGEVAFGYYQSGEGELTAPTQLDINSKNQILALDSALPGYMIYDYFGNYLSQVTDREMKLPVGIAVDLEDRVYICDITSRAVFIFSAKGQIIGKIDQIGGIPLIRPADISVRQNGQQYLLYILDGDSLISAALTFQS